MANTDVPNPILLIGYLEESLAPEEMVRIEERLRASNDWREALMQLRDEIDLGEHAVSTIWRRHRLSCPSRERLGSYLCGGLPPDVEDYVRFHVEVIQCRWCGANLDDLRSLARSASPASPGDRRRRRFFESSIGHLPKRNE